MTYEGPNGLRVKSLKEAWTVYDEATREATREASRKASREAVQVGRAHKSLRKHGSPAVAAPRASIPHSSRNGDTFSCDTFWHAAAPAAPGENQPAATAPVAALSSSLGGMVIAPAADTRAPRSFLQNLVPAVSKQKRLARLEAATWACVGRLAPWDGNNRNLVLARLQEIGWWAVPGSSMLLFGSTACELHADGADLDLTLIPQPHAQHLPSYVEQQALVRHLAVAFQSFQASGEFMQVEAVDRARVPILKLQHRASGLQCDISIGNRLAVQKTRLLHAYVRLDQRVRPLCLIVKHCVPHTAAALAHAHR